MKEIFAAIDVGSNAIRMIISERGPVGFRPIKKYRVPIRLGADVFEAGKIAPRNMKAAARAFREFAKISKRAKANRIRAVGTAALREASNGAAFVELVKRKSQIQIDVIDGVQEASIIHLAVKHSVDLNKKNALLLDIGGGSAELTFSEDGFMSATQSFPFGTLRTLENLHRRKLGEKNIEVLLGEYVQPIADFIHSHKSQRKLDFLVGTGGNMEAMGKLKAPLLGVDSKNYLSVREAESLFERLQLIPHKQRVEKLKMKPDRADVILPALGVVLTVLRQSGAEKMLIPCVGLKDGILLTLIDEGS